MVRLHLVVDFLREMPSFGTPRYAGKTVITSDHALKLEWIPDWVGIIGSG